MTHIHLLTSCMLGLLLAGTSAASHGAAAVAKGDRNYTYTIVNADDTDSARSEALAECVQRASNCRILTATPHAGALAMAKGDDGMYVQHHADPARARALALANCKASYKNCRFVAIYWEQGTSWGAVGRQRKGDGALHDIYFEHSHASQALASDAVMARCKADIAPGSGNSCDVTMQRRGAWTYVLAESKNGSGMGIAETAGEATEKAMNSCSGLSKPENPCKVTKTIASRALQPEPATYAAVAAQTRAASPPRPVAARPAATNGRLTCSNRCVNGNCVRTFPNGRSERWQAQQVFDPFTNNWKWETSSCGA